MSFHIPAYLRRLGMEEPVHADSDALMRLTQSHLRTVPFENLQITDEHTEPDLDPEALFQKIIHCKRGGYCFELNKLFCLLLKELGFHCYSVAARVIHGRQEPCALSHQAIIALVDGTRYFCDVGFGGAGPKGILSLDTQDIQTVAGESFRVRKDPDSYVICLIHNDMEQPVLRVHDYPWQDVDFLTLNRYYATYPGSPFRKKRILYKCSATGWRSLVDNLLTVQENGAVETLLLHTEEEIRTVIAEQFGLSVWDKN